MNIPKTAKYITNNTLKNNIMYYSYLDGFTSELPNINKTDFLKVERCGHTEKEVLTLYYFGMEQGDPLCLHSEDEVETQKSVELFKNKDAKFCLHLEFFTEDNPHRVNDILKTSFVVYDEKEADFLRFSSDNQVVIYGDYTEAKEDAQGNQTVKAIENDQIENGLVTGANYWIFDGKMNPFKATLTGFNHNRKTALFGNIARKITSVYNTEKQALTVNQY